MLINYAFDTTNTHVFTSTLQQIDGKHTCTIVKFNGKQGITVMMQFEVTHFFVYYQYIEKQ